MNEQLWGIGGVVAGIVVTAAGTWWNDRSKHERERRTATRQEGRKRCEALLTAIDDELASLEAYEDEHGVFPADNGHDFQSSRGREMLTHIQLSCPPKLYASANALVDATEAWGWKGGSQVTLESARHDFIELVRKKL